MFRRLWVAVSMVAVAVGGVGCGGSSPNVPAEAPPQAVLEELTSSLPAARIEHLVDDLANRLSFVRHLVGAGR